MRFECVYDATAEKVWAALTEPEQLRGWLAEVDIDPHVGGSIQVRFGAESTMNGCSRRPSRATSRSSRSCSRPHRSEASTPAT